MSLVAQVRSRLASLGDSELGLVVAVSGGADSVALLRALVLLRASTDSTILTVAHLNHGLRGSESDADAEFTQRLCAEFRLNCRCDKVDVAGMVRAEGGNLEAVARRERYAWLAQVAVEFQAARIATGHTADDQAETVLHRLLRGAGLQGLRGIAARRELRPGIELIRPLLSTTRADVLAFLQEIDQPFREDRSNADLRFTRNRIRHELLPRLAADYNPGIRENLAQLAEQAAAVFDDIERLAQAKLRECELPAAGDMIILDQRLLTLLPRNLLRELLRQLWQREQWPRDRMRFEDWDRAAAVALGEQPAVDLPGQVHVRGHGRVVQFRRDRIAE